MGPPQITLNSFNAPQIAVGIYQFNFRCSGKRRVKQKKGITVVCAGVFRYMYKGPIRLYHALRVRRPMATAQMLLSASLPILVLPFPISLKSHPSANVSILKLRHQKNEAGARISAVGALSCAKDVLGQISQLLKILCNFVQSWYPAPNTTTKFGRYSSRSSLLLGRVRVGVRLARWPIYLAVHVQRLLLQ